MPSRGAFVQPLPRVIEKLPIMPTTNTRDYHLMLVVGAGMDITIQFHNQ
jgi:hypothetical protein